MTLAQFGTWTSLALTCAIVLWRGREPERLGAAIVAVGYVLTPFVERLDSWYQPQYGILAVDAAVLVLLTGVALRYDRLWPIWATSLQAIAVLTHFLFLINPQALYRAYYYGYFSIGYLILGAILGGVVIESPIPFHLRRWAVSRTPPRP